LALAICNGLRPEFGEGTPEVYKKLAYRCMNANSSKRPIVKELNGIFRFWHGSICSRQYEEKELFGYKGKQIKAVFEKADNEIPKIAKSYEKDPDAIYISRAFTFNNLSKPVNTSFIKAYLEEDEDNNGTIHFCTDD
jgi:hypothetical protein